MTENLRAGAYFLLRALTWLLALAAATGLVATLAGDNARTFGMLVAVAALGVLAGLCHLGAEKL